MESIIVCVPNSSWALVWWAQRTAEGLAWWRRVAVEKAFCEKWLQATEEVCDEADE